MKTLFCALGACVVCAAHAVPVPWTNSITVDLTSVGFGVYSYAPNGHCYDLIKVDGGVDWQSAKEAAEAAGGYLATVTSMGENVFLTQSFNPVPTAETLYGHWLGGYQEWTPYEPAAGWKWINEDGEISGAVLDWLWNPAVAYNNWDRVAGPNGFSFVEPNNQDGREDRLMFAGGELCPFNGVMWNDAAANVPAFGYVIEWDRDPRTIPDGGRTLVLAGTVLLLLALQKRRARC